MHIAHIKRLRLFR